MCVSYWTLAEFACAIHAKVLRAETPPDVARSVHSTLEQLIKTNALQHIAVLREDYKSVQNMAPDISCLVRGADALHLAVAERSGITHFASLDKTQRQAAAQWLTGVVWVPVA